MRVMERTIAAIITGPCTGAVGVIRLSGEDAFDIADRVFSGSCGPLAKQKSHTVHYGVIRDKDGQRIDDCLATVFVAPRSYTGENVVELACHGGRYLLQTILSLVIAAGAREAQPGEFTKRAFLNGRMDLSQAEAVADIVAAQGILEARNAAAHMEGALGQRIAELIDALLTENAAILAYVDYPDEDIDEPDLKAICGALERVRAECAALLATCERGRVLKEGVRCALAGKPNTGKSSLMNRLAGEERSIVTDEAGTTRDVVEEVLVLGDVKLRLMDTAGIRQAFSQAERIGVERARRAAEKAELLLCVFDGSSPADDSDRLIMELAEKKTAIAVINKSDLPQRFCEDGIKGCFAQTVRVSALIGEGMENLCESIRRALFSDAPATDGETLVTSARQRDALQKAADALSRAMVSARSGLSLDVLSFDIAEAVGALGLMTGRTVSEETVNKIFSRFCVGK